MRHVGWMLGLVIASGCGGDEEGTGGASPGGTGGVGGLAEGGGGQGGGPLGPVRMTAEVTRYGYRFDLATGAASSTVELAVQEAGNCLALPTLLPVSAATLGGLPAAAVHDGTTLEACAGWVDAGETVTLATDQSVPEATYLGLDVGFSRRDNGFGGTFSYVLSWVGGCDLFGPCDDRPDALTAFDIEIAHPPGTLTLCPGDREVLSATSTRCTITSPLAPTYSAFALVADDQWVESPFVSGGGVTLRFFEPPGGGVQAALDPAAVTAFLDWITATLGPYPYGDTIRVATGPTAWLGFEHPANIVLRSDLQALNLSFGDPALHVLAHEIIHQWAGDHTTLAAEADFVWKEAICEYLAYVFEDDNAPPSEALATRTYWDSVSIGAQFHPRPLDEPTPPVETFYGDVYGPGPMVLFLQLEPALGRAAILAGIAAFLAEPGARSVEDLRLALEASSGEDLAAWFDAWVYGTGAPTWPTFDASFVQQGDQVTVTVDQGRSPRGGVVEVDVAGATSTLRASVDFGLAPTTASAQAVVTLAEPVLSLAVDPDHRVVDQPAAAQAGRPKIWRF